MGYYPRLSCHRVTWKEDCVNPFPLCIRHYLGEVPYNGTRLGDISLCDYELRKSNYSIRVSHTYLLGDDVEIEN